MLRVSALLICDATNCNKTVAESSSFFLPCLSMRVDEAGRDSAGFMMEERSRQEPKSGCKNHV